MSKGSFLDVILMLHATLSFSLEANEPLSHDDSEEGGIFMRQEVIDALEKFSRDIKTLCPKIDLKDSKYNPVQILKMSQFSCPNSLKKPVSLFFSTKLFCSRLLFVNFLFSLLPILICWHKVIFNQKVYYLELKKIC